MKRFTRYVTRKALFNMLMALGLLLTLGSGTMLAYPAQAHEPGPQAEMGSQAALGTAFTYQGYLKDGSGPVNETCDFQFGLWDANSSGGQIGSTQTASSVDVDDGYFTVPNLDFGTSAFTGDARYLQIDVRCPAGSGSYTTLSGRVALNAAPYAHSLRPGAVIEGNVSTGLKVETSAGGTAAALLGYASSQTGQSNGVYGSTDSTDGGAGVVGRGEAVTGKAYGVAGVSFAPSGAGVYGTAPTTGTVGIATSGAGPTWGVYGKSDASGGYGVYGENTSGGTTYGVYGLNDSSSGAGVYGKSENATGVGVRGETVNGHAVEGIVDWTSGGAGYGVYGSGGLYGYGGGFENATTDVPTVQIKNLNYTAGGPALHVYGTTVVSASVSGIGASGSGLYVHNSKSSGVAHGIYGQTDASSGYGVYGQGPTIGVYGNGSTAGVYGEGSTSGVHGITSGAGAHGVYGQNSNSSSGYGVYGRGFRGVEGYSDSADGAGGFFRNTSATASENSVGMWAGSYYGDIIQGHELGSDGTSMNRRFRVTYQGDVYIDGTYYDTGADFAEMLPAAQGLEPGDVLIIGPDGQLARSSEAYQPTVVGVYSTKPAFVGGSDEDMENPGKVPLAIVGIVPVKASAENGPIAPGDLLVASSIPGHAMKAGPNPPIGTIIGKALAGLASGVGVIQLLVTLQ
ncbi:MAG: hypothetical protein U9Q70_07235 [Chloroflexota bacterium]|nr:hypothetical protein [Chloroflexota bacterium]